MDQTFLSALIGLSGAVVGSGASFATTYVTRQAELREQRLERDRKARQQLYAAFVSEASRLYGDALTHEKDDVADLVAAYALLSQMRLFASAAVLNAAEDALAAIVASYQQPNLALHELHVFASRGGMDPLQGFAQACRAELTRSPSTNSWWPHRHSQPLGWRGPSASEGTFNSQMRTDGA